MGSRRQEQLSRPVIFTAKVNGDVQRLPPTFEIYSIVHGWVDLRNGMCAMNLDKQSGIQKYRAITTFA